MFRLLLFTLLTLASTRSGLSPLAAGISPSVFKLFSSYIQSNTKIYRTVSEYQYRFNIFNRNLSGIVGDSSGLLSEKVSIVDTRNGSVIKVKQGNGACDFEMTLNDFFDLTDEEFESFYLLPAHYFDSEKYKPVSKIVKKIDGVDKLIELDENMDPFDELVKTEKRSIKSTKSKKKSSKKRSNELLKDEIIQELKTCFDATKRKIDISKMKEPEDQGVPQGCRTQYNIRASIVNGMLDSYNYSYSQVPSNVDFSHVFSERRLQSQLSLPAKYLQQDFANHVELDGTVVPGFLDWNQIAPMTPVKDQAKCNSCYVFSATAALEAHNNIINNIYKPVSEQEIIDCSRENEGCTGGQPYLVYDYVIKNGLAYDNTYPYLAKENSCKANNAANSRNRFGGLKGYVFPKPGMINLLKALQFGPVVIVMYASKNLKYYYDGIYDGQGCNGTETPNHSALVYGYNLNSPKPYLMIKNGWGTNWGDDGHFKMSIGKLSNDNTGYCYIAKTRYNVIPVMKR